jgi:4-diphosphocytidyl-2-C-methyl-D-erythritol kinase
VVGRRADGYHLLESLAVFAGVGDTLCVEAPADPAASSLSLELAGPYAAGLAAEGNKAEGNKAEGDTAEGDNLVLRAARALAAAANVAPAARLLLDKRLPIASGIGGGSADAAAALRVLARLWCAAGADVALAVRLGADVPVCLASRPRMMRGIGDVLNEAPALPEYGLALVNPGVAVSTADVFRARAGGFSLPVALPVAWHSAADMAADLAIWGNDLQGPAEALCPPVSVVLAALRATPGCLLAQMSGSGATCFGLYATAAAAAAAAVQITRPGQPGRPGWWAWGGAPHTPTA